MKIIPLPTITMPPSFLLRKQIEEEIMEYFNSPERLLEGLEIVSTSQEFIANLKHKGV